MDGRKDRKVWLVTGASRGLGQEISRAARRGGDLVVRAMRSPVLHDDDDHQMTVQLDVTDERSVREAVEAAEHRFGRIDVLVNNAGYGLIGGIEEVNAQEARALFATNVDGMLNVLRAALPGMRKRRSGNIVNLSSIGGISASVGWGVYNQTCCGRS